jgi:hypothetical protein
VEQVVTTETSPVVEAAATPAKGQPEQTQIAPEVEAHAASLPATKTGDSQSGEWEKVETPSEAHDRQLFEIQAELADAAVEIAEAKAATKSAAKRFESLVERYAELKNSEPERLPLFDRETPKPKPATESTSSQPSDQPSTETTPATESTPAETPEVTPEVDPNGWRSVSITDLDIPAGTAKLLIEAGIDTIGKMADFTATPNQRLTDVKGIGQGKAERIENAMIAFWAANPQFCRGS